MVKEKKILLDKLGKARRLVEGIKDMGEVVKDVCLSSIIQQMAEPYPS